MKPELIIALDVPTATNIPQVVDQLPERVIWYKIGLELFTSEGPAAFTYLQQRNKRIFLDLKLHDIPRTVERAVASAARHKVGMLTVHASGGRAMIRAAADSAHAAGAARPRIIAVTTLTSLDAKDLADIGISRSLPEHTLALGLTACEAGADGLVCSSLEAHEFRKRLGPDCILVTPGIRPADADAGDQKRIDTPRDAVQAGANYLVVGRPILEAKDPRAAAEEILKQMAG